MALAALVVSVAVVAAILLRSGDPYRLEAVFADAGQLVKGGRVTVGGVQVGSVEAIRLDDRNRAVVTLAIEDDEFAPLHDGTVASIRSPSLSTQAGRYVSLHPGPNSGPALRDGALLQADDTEGIVDLDALFNTLDAQTRSALQGIVRGMATGLEGQAENANRALYYLNPALSRTARLTGELARDERAFERFIVESAGVVSAIAPRTAELQHGIASAAALTGRLAEEDATIGRLLERAPGVLRRAESTLAGVEEALEDSRPALRAAQPVAPRLAKVLKLSAPVARDARPAVRDVAGLLPDALRALRGLPKTAAAGTEAFETTTKTLAGTRDIVPALRAYTPDLVAGLFNGFGGNVAGYYDANGRYARIGFSLPPTFLTQGLTGVGGPLADVLNTAQGGGHFTRFPNYCPGGSVAPADASMPWHPEEVHGHCDLSQTPPK
jgi:phospholipid/cholesterol/gamma-HCH transport system substrate-binding protein